MDAWSNLGNLISTFIMGNIISIIAVLVSLILFILGLKRKGFSDYIESVNSVVRVKKDVSEKVQVFYEGSPVENVFLIVMMIRNSGNQPILFEDYVNSVTFDFGWDAIILSSSIVDTEPHSLDPRFNLNPNTVELLPLLLNGGDNMTVNFLISNWDPEAFEVHGRIKGVKDIKRELENSVTNSLLKIFAGIVLVSMLIFMYFDLITIIQGLYFEAFTIFLIAMAGLSSRGFRKSYRAYRKRNA